MIGPALDLISIGECMVEFSGEGSLGESSHFRRSYGGDTLNVLVAAARLGSRTGFISRVGRDPFGTYLFSSWQEEGIDTSWVKQMDGFNGIYFISLKGAGEREFHYYRSGSAASSLGPEDIDESYIRSGKIIFSSGITQAISSSARGAVLRAFQIARSAGSIVAYDPNLREVLWSRGIREAKGAFDAIIPFSDVVLPSGPYEIERLLGTPSPREAIKYLWRAGIKVVAVKLGPRGSVVGVDGEMREVPSLSVAAVDTTGAGDAFNGAFLHGLAEGMHPFDAGRLAGSVASLKVQSRGAIPGLPKRSEAYALFRDRGPEGKPCIST